MTYDPIMKARRTLWNMNQRCFNPKNAGYPRYGGRGITVCDRWRHSFKNFLADMGPPPAAHLSIVLGDGWDLMIAHPDCTRLTNAGVRWLKVPPPGKTLAQMWQGLFEGAAFYRLLRDYKAIPMRVIENPVMHCHARELIRPGFRQVVQPWWFGDEAFKATGLELIGVPPLKPTNKLTPPKKGTPEHKAWSVIQIDRSRTFPGIADAMGEQWGGMVEQLEIAA